MRVVCVANLRREKDQLALLEAFRIVIELVPRASLLLVGSPVDLEYTAKIRSSIERLGLGRRAFLMGERHDVRELLPLCDIGVLSSVSEGMPLALLEYGAAGLPTIATDVGECSEVLGHGSAGLIVPARDINSLSDALIRLLTNDRQKKTLGASLQSRIRRYYSLEGFVQNICDVYEYISSP
jgi:glycosyltransferase involved in cell wall biosynthesis